MSESTLSSGEEEISVMKVKTTEHLPYSQPWQAVLGKIPLIDMTLFQIRLMILLL